jgi:hypothetical protein
VYGLFEGGILAENRRLVAKWRPAGMPATAQEKDEALLI